MCPGICTKFSDGCCVGEGRRFWVAREDFICHNYFTCGGITQENMRRRVKRSEWWLIIGFVVTILAAIIAAIIDPAVSFYLQARQEARLTREAQTAAAIAISAAQSETAAAPTLTDTPINTPSDTPTNPPTVTPIPTEPPTVTLTATLEPSETPVPSLTPTEPPPTAIPTSPAPSYPCQGQIINPFSQATTLTIIRGFPNSEVAPLGYVIVGETVDITGRSSGANAYFQIETERNTSGWVAGDYVTISDNCPSQ